MKKLVSKYLGFLILMPIIMIMISNGKSILKTVVGVLAQTWDLQENQSFIIATGITVHSTVSLGM